MVFLKPWPQLPEIARLQKALLARILIVYKPQLTMIGDDLF